MLASACLVAARELRFFTANGGETVLATSVDKIFSSRNASRVAYTEPEVVAGKGGSLVGVGVKGAARTILATGVVAARLGADGSTIVYQTQDGAILRSSTLPGSTPLLLAAAGRFGTIADVSSALDWALVAGPDESAGPVLARISLSTPTPPGPVGWQPGFAVLAATDGYTDGFTTDGTHALFLRKGPSSGTFDADLFSWPVSSPPTLLAPRVTIAVAIGGAKVELDQVNATNPAFDDVAQADLASGGAVVSLATGITSHASSLDSKTIVYTTDVSPEGAGLFVRSVP